MKCSILGCPGQYESRKIVHTVNRGSEIYVFENVPADVCPECGDTLLAPETIQHLDMLMRGKEKPERLIPVYEYA